VYKAKSAIKLERLNKTFSILQTYDKMYKYVHKKWHTAIFCTNIHMLHHISKHVGPSVQVQFLRNSSLTSHWFGLRTFLVPDPLHAQHVLNTCGIAYGIKQATRSCWTLQIRWLSC